VLTVVWNGAPTTRKSQEEVVPDGLEELDAN
jgi:hypothetical protein